MHGACDTVPVEDVEPGTDVYQSRDTVAGTVVRVDADEQDIVIDAADGMHWYVEKFTDYRTRDGYYVQDSSPRGGVFRCSYCVNVQLHVENHQACHKDARDTGGDEIVQ